MNNQALDEMLLKLRVKNAANPLFKSKIQSIKERQEKDEAREFYRLSESYLNLSLDDKKKVVNLAILAQSKNTKGNKRQRIVFYRLNEWKRSMRFGKAIFPSYLEHKISFTAPFLQLRSTEVPQEKPLSLCQDALASNS